MLLTITLTPVAFEQHIKSAQTEEGLASLFVEGRSDSKRLTVSVLKWASEWVSGCRDVSEGCLGA